MQPYISMITLGVRDLVNSCKFYENGLGLRRFVFDSENVVFFDLAGTWLCLFPRAALAEDAGVEAISSGFSGFSLAHNLSSEILVDAQMAEAKAAGAVIVKPAHKTFWGGYAGYFSDLDGYLWEVAHNPFMHIGPKAQ